MLRIKNKKSVAVILGTAFLFYQMHSVDLTGWKPEWLTTASLKQKSYNVVRSPLFWTVLGSGMIAVAVWNLYNKRSASGGGVLPSSSPTVRSAGPVGVPEAPLPPVSGNAPREVLLSLERKEREEKEWRAERAVPPTIESKVHAILNDILKKEAGTLQRLCNMIKTNLSRNTFFPINSLETIKRLGQNCSIQGLMTFFQENSNVAVSSMLSINSSLGGDDILHQFVRDLQFVYRVRYLLRMISARDMQLFKQHYVPNTVTRVDEYLIAQLPLAEGLNKMEDWVKGVGGIDLDKFAPEGQEIAKALEYSFSYTQPKFLDMKVPEILAGYSDLRYMMGTVIDDLPPELQGDNIPKELYEIGRLLWSDILVDVDSIEETLLSYSEAIYTFAHMKEPNSLGQSTKAVFESLIESWKKAPSTSTLLDSLGVRTDPKKMRPGPPRRRDR